MAFERVNERAKAEPRREPIISPKPEASGETKRERWSNGGPRLGRRGAAAPSPACGGSPPGTERSEGITGAVATGILGGDPPEVGRARRAERSEKASSHKAQRAMWV